MNFNEIDIEAYIKAEQLDQLLPYDNKVITTASAHKSSLYGGVDNTNDNPYPIDWGDLVRIHSIIRTRKVLTALEFGTGYSSLIIADALKKNKAEHASFAEKNIRRKHKFELHVVEVDQKWIDIARERLNSLADHVTYHQANVVTGTFQGRICTFYDNLPKITPDFIYLDAPDQFNIQGNINGFSTADEDLVPMAADILSIEYFLLPGTFILVDGRNLNVRFLQAHFKRNWKLTYYPQFDCSTFELVEPPIGNKNKTQLEWQLGKAFLENQ